MLLSEQEFYITLGHTMRRMRKKAKLGPGQVSRRLGTVHPVYFAIEKGKLAPSPYQIYLFMAATAPGMLSDGRWPFQDISK